MPKPTFFAHLLGLDMGRRARGSKAASPVEDDPLDEQYAEDDDDEPNAKGKARGRRAEDDDDKPDAEDDDDKPDAEDDDDKPGAKVRGKARSRRAEDDDDKPDAEDEDDDKPSAAVARERARCAHIMAYGLKNGMGAQAFVMAFDSGMSKAAAINVLKANKAAAPKQVAGASLQHAMGQLGVHQVAPDASAELPAGIDATTALIIKSGM